MYKYDPNESQCGFRPNRSTVDMVFSLRQLQEKCREQQRPLYMAFIDLTKAFDLVSRDGLFKVLRKIGCPPTLLSIIESFHKDMKGTVVFDGSTSGAFEIRSGVKQGCVLAPTLFGTFFSVLLKYAFGSATEGIYLRTRSDGKLFNLARLRAKTKVTIKRLRDFLFADDAAVATHSEEELQMLIDRFASACREFGLTISQKKTQVMGQGTDSPPCIKIAEYKLEAVDDFTYLGSTISNSLCLDKELDRRLGKAATTMSRLNKRAWTNNKLTEHTKVQIYTACVVSTLLYGSEAWVLHARQEKRLNVFHMRQLRRIFNITWEDKVPNNVVLAKAGMPSMFTLLKQRRMRWLGHVTRMEDGRIPKDLLYGELQQGTRRRGRPNLRFRDICKRDMKAMNIDTATWETLAANRASWKRSVNVGLSSFEDTLRHKSDKMRIQRKARSQILQPSKFVCDNCERDCHSGIGLISHQRRCAKP